jgi:hypothetical protein
MDPTPDAPRPNSTGTRRPLDRAAAGDPATPCDLLARHRADLLAFVRLHLDPRAAVRAEPSDVVQGTSFALAPVRPSLRRSGLPPNAGGSDRRSSAAPACIIPGVHFVRASTAATSPQNT